MKIHHLRSATFVIEVAGNVILVDPMLGKKGSQAPFTMFRFKSRRNPIIHMPRCSQSILEKVTHCLITHKHPDHFDLQGEIFLKERNIPVICSKRDKSHFQKKGLNISQTVDYWKKDTFLGGSIIGIPTRHGYGFIAYPMGNVMGFYLELPNSPSIYISSDTVYTSDVEKALKQFKPDLSVVASGSAQLDLGQPLLMRMDDIIKFIKNSPHKVLANHLEAVNHCPTTREQLKNRLVKEGLEHKVFIPNDGEVIEM